jgi:hypothetical protein
MNKWENAAMKLRKTIEANNEKARDLDVIIAEVQKLPHGQLKEVLTNRVMAVLEKYGYTG